MVQVAYQNVVEGPENTHAFLELCREKEVGIAFIGEAWIEKNSRGTQTYLSIVQVSMAKRGRRVMAYVRKGMEEEVEVVNEEDNHIILPEKKTKRIESMYTNGRWHEER